MKFQTGNKVATGRKTGSRTKKSNSLRSKWQKKLEKDLPALWDCYTNLPPSEAKVKIGLQMHALIMPRLATQRVTEAPVESTQEKVITMVLDSQHIEPVASLEPQEAALLGSPGEEQPKDAEEVLNALNVPEQQRGSRYSFI
jgi:hypothetical protein